VGGTLDPIPQAVLKECYLIALPSFCFGALLSSWAMLTWIETETGPRPPVTEGIMLRHRAPGPTLARDVIAISGYQESVSQHFRQILPASLTVSWIISFGEPFLIGLGQAPHLETVGWSFVAGMSTVPVTIDSFGAASCIRVDFTPPGARRFFNLPMHELAGRMVAFDNILAGHAADLCDRLSAEPDWEQRFNIVETFLADRLLQLDQQPLPTAWAFDRLVRTGGIERIGAIAAKLGWSRKHLAAKFHDEIGLTPKTVARMARFNLALVRARRGGGGWAELAHDCGYADQAHLVRDFKAFAGASPTAWQARLNPAP
jgi:AraC-like DNA-binding protein